MHLPTYGNSSPIVATFVLIRVTQVVCFAGILGLTGNFVSEIVTTQGTPPKEIVGVLAVTSLLALYCLISLPYFWAHANVGLIVMAVLDLIGAICFVAISVSLGKSLSYLNCFLIGNASASEDASSALAFTQSLGSNFGKEGDLVSWAGTTRANCFESKTIWGLGIALAVLFTCNVILLPSLWFKARRGLE